MSDEPATVGAHQRALMRYPLPSHSSCTIFVSAAPTSMPIQPRFRRSNDQRVRLRVGAFSENGIDEPLIVENWISKTLLKLHACGCLGNCAGLVGRYRAIVEASNSGNITDMTTVATTAPRRTIKVGSASFTMLRTLFSPSSS